MRPHLPVLLVLGLLGCGTGARDGAGSAPAARGPTSGPSPAHGVGPKVSLVVGEKQVDIGLGEVAPGPDGKVRLAALWRAGMPTEEPMLLHFDLVDVHGFHLATSPACRPLLNGSDFAAAMIDVATHDVTYDAALSIQDCYRMRAVQRIVGIRGAGPGATP